MNRDALWTGTAIERPTVVAVYLGFAHLALIGLGLAITLRPEALATTEAHPLAVAMTHALTLGWISASILGSLYLVLPLALAARLTVHTSDVVMAALFALGAIGVVAATAVGRTDLIAAPGAVCTTTFAVVGTRAVRALSRSRAPAAITAHVFLAFVSILLAASLALAWGAGWLRVPRADFVAAHAHLAAVGFAVTIAVGIGHRLLPMFLPAAPRGARLMWATLLVPVGALTLALALLTASTLVLVGAAVSGLGIAVFALGVVRMLRNGRPPPRDLVRPDPGKVQILLAVASLLATTSVGIVLATSAGTPRLTFAYGVLGLLGFLGQLIAGIGSRLFPTWLWASSWRTHVSAGGPPATSPTRMPSRPLLWTALVCIAFAVATLSLGAGTTRLAVIRAGGLALLVGGLALAANLVGCVRRVAVAP